MISDSRRKAKKKKENVHWHGDHCPLSRQWIVENVIKISTGLVRFTIWIWNGSLYVPVGLSRKTKKKKKEKCKIAFIFKSFRRLFFFSTFSCRAFAIHFFILYDFLIIFHSTTDLWQVYLWGEIKNRIKWFCRFLLLKQSKRIFEKFISFVIKLEWRCI